MIALASLDAAKIESSAAGDDQSAHACRNIHTTLADTQLLSLDLVPTMKKHTQQQTIKAIVQQIHRHKSNTPAGNDVMCTACLKHCTLVSFTLFSHSRCPNSTRVEFDPVVIACMVNNHSLRNCSTL
jgi:hypothetical protein